MDHRHAVTRRQAALGAIATSLMACAARSTNEPEKDEPKDPLLAPPQPEARGDGVDALAEILLPTERDAKGAVTVPGAIDARADEVLRLESFVSVALAQGFLPPLPRAFVDAAKRTKGGFRAALEITLDALSGVDRPLTRFVDLSPREREAIVARMFDDPAHKPAVLVVRAACFTAYLGAMTNDLGLQAVGFPPFEDFHDRLACSGYPRKDARGAVDDYTYDRAPAPTPGDDLSLVLDANGDLK